MARYIRSADGPTLESAGETDEIPFPTEGSAEKRHTVAGFRLKGFRVEGKRQDSIIIRNQDRLKWSH